MNSKQRKLLKELQTYYSKNPAINRETSTYDMKMNKLDLAYLEAKGLVTIEWDQNLKAFVTLTNSGITYFYDQRSKRYELFIKSGLFPVIVTILTTLLLRHLN